jgi:hypothetical protein
MNRQIQTSLTAACALALGFTVATAQSQDQSSPRPPAGARAPAASTEPSQASTSAITLTGCVVNDTTAGGTTGRPSGAAQIRGAFRLTNVQMGAPGRSADGSASAAHATPGAASRSGASQATQGATDAAGAAPHATTYRLMPAGGVDFSAHLNHRVQVTGTQSGVSSAEAGSATAMSTGSAQSPGSGSANNSGSGSAPAKPSPPTSTQSSDSRSGQHGSLAAESAAVPTLLVTNITMIASTCQ